MNTVMFHQNQPEMRSVEWWQANHIYSNCDLEVRSAKCKLLRYFWFLISMQCFIEIHVKIKVKTCRVTTRKCEETDAGYAIRTEGMTLTDNELIFSAFPPQMDNLLFSVLHVLTLYFGRFMMVVCHIYPSSVNFNILQRQSETCVFSKFVNITN